MQDPGANGFAVLVGISTDIINYIVQSILTLTSQTLGKGLKISTSNLII